MSQPAILWDDEECYVCVKPPNLSTTSHPDKEAPTLAEWLQKTFPEVENTSPSEGEAGVCHRLDFETSGLVLGAKTQTSYTNIRKQFEEHSVEKMYVCLVEGLVEKIEQRPITLSGYLYGRYRRSKKVQVSKTRKERSSFASLHFTVQQHFPQQNCSLLSVSLETGFRHQIRAQLADYGHPLVGDELYGSPISLEDLSFQCEPFGDVGRKFFLHAESLSFLHPVTGERKTHVSPSSVNIG